MAVTLCLCLLTFLIGCQGQSNRTSGVISTVASQDVDHLFTSTQINTAMERTNTNPTLVHGLVSSLTSNSHNVIPGRQSSTDDFPLVQPTQSSAYKEISEHKESAKSLTKSLEYPKSTLSDNPLFKQFDSSAEVETSSGMFRHSLVTPSYSYQTTIKDHVMRSYLSLNESSRTVSIEGTLTANSIITSHSYKHTIPYVTIYPSDNFHTSGVNSLVVGYNEETVTSSPEVKPSKLKADVYNSFIDEQSFSGFSSDEIFDVNSVIETQRLYTSPLISTIYRPTGKRIQSTVTSTEKKPSTIPNIVPSPLSQFETSYASKYTDFTSSFYKTSQVSVSNSLAPTPVLEATSITTYKDVASVVLSSINLDSATYSNVLTTTQKVDLPQQLTTSPMLHHSSSASALTEITTSNIQPYLSPTTESGEITLFSTLSSVYPSLLPTTQVKQKSSEIFTSASEISSEIFSSASEISSEIFSSASEISSKIFSSSASEISSKRFSSSASEMFSSTASEILTSVTTSPPETENVYKNCRYLFTFSGDCQLVTNNTLYLAEFIEGLRETLVEKLDISNDRIKPHDISCGSIKIYVTFKNVSCSKMSRAVKNLVESRNLIVPTYIENQVITFTAESVRQVALRETSVNSMNQPANGIDKIDIIVIIVACCICGVLLVIGITVCVKECYRRKYAQSFDLLDMPHVNLKLEDFTLTRIPRPKTTYNNDNSSVHGYPDRYSSQSLNIENGQPVTNGNHLNLSDVHVRMQPLNEGIVVGVTGYTTPNGTSHKKKQAPSASSNFSSADPLGNPSTENLMPEHHYSSIGNLNPIFVDDDDQGSTSTLDISQAHTTFVSD